jgi:archaellum biogenesis ATPase FlaH
MRKVFPFLKAEYFHSEPDQVVFKEIDAFIAKYNQCPSLDAIKIQIINGECPEHVFKSVEVVLDEVARYEPINFDWLYDQSEKFCKDKSVYNAILKSIQIIDGKEQTVSQDSIPTILQEALSVCFDTNIGHDYLENTQSRWEFYHKEESRISFDIDILNKITNGGIPNKTLTVLMSSSGGGKSLAMCHMAAANLAAGKNVMYITMEMAEERIAERIDANLLNIPVIDLKNLPMQMFESRMGKIKGKTSGKLIIKEYPTAGAHAGHFRALINELQLKKSFRPDILYIDYLNICASSRYKASSAVNSYTLVKSIAEELRGMAVEFDMPIVSATQVNRTGYGSSDVEMTDTSESMGIVHTVDLFLAIIGTEELDAQGQIMFKQLKNRFGDPNMFKRFLVGIDRSKMKLYDLDIKMQKDIADAGTTDDDSLNFKPRSKFKAVSGINV